MSRAQRIQDQITRELSPLHLELIDETTQHNAPPEGESHFKLLVVSNHFTGLKPLARHRLINGLLGDEFAAGLHALAMHTWTPDEWFLKGGQAPTSPPCLGGDKD
ncbi:MAG: BolA family transcriptional regulator [Chromatiaceae bacterium]|nr:BolA family transcriptional regulator [Chromatiaceae bacterium]MBP8197746.1 BolA family transcriptional regulator [Chromatiaceae bacterium]